MLSFFLWSLLSASNPASQPANKQRKLLTDLSRSRGSLAWWFRATLKRQQNMCAVRSADFPIGFLVYDTFQQQAKEYTSTHTHATYY
uniref:Putative secreted protein n=1 Tax=Anopheles marajoara TaxID=58244 RepID=A0A2M4CAE0_9DIPT